MLFRNRIRCLPQADLKLGVPEKLKWLDGMMTGKAYVCFSRLTLADIMLFAILDFANDGGRKLSTDTATIAAWFARMTARPSAAA